MVLGTTLFKLDGTPYYSPPFAKGNDAALFSVQVSHVANSPSLVVTVQHRNNNETSWSNAGAFSAITAAGLYTLDIAGLKELVRLEYTVGGASWDCAVHLFVPAPSWRAN